MSLEEAVAVLVPVLMDLNERHARGERVYVHPSAIAPGTDGLARLNPALALLPTQAADKHCLAPELQRTLEPGDACSSVFSIGAMLYEMVTGLHIGAAMRRPREIEPSLPDSLEVLIGKAIIGERAHRPADLGALASALYHVAPRKSIHPPDVSESRLDASAQLDVDVRFSMLPPSIAPMPPASARDTSHVKRVNGQGEPFGAPVIDRTHQPGRRTADDPTAKLGALKAQLESDPRPRYVVNKDKMDHGPFTAVELLQQIASHAFVGGDGLRDEISGQQMPISEWEEFSQFAGQAALGREKRAEEKAVVRAADADKKRGIAKSILAVSIVIALAGVAVVWFFTRRGTRNEDVVVSNDRGGAVVVNGDIKGKKRPAGGAGHAGRRRRILGRPELRSRAELEQREHHDGRERRSRSDQRSARGAAAARFFRHRMRSPRRHEGPGTRRGSHGRSHRRHRTNHAAERGRRELHRPRRPRIALASQREDRFRHHELLKDREPPAPERRALSPVGSSRGAPRLPSAARSPGGELEGSAPAP